jgi:hypothetical protein
MASWWRSRAVVLGTALLALIAVVALAARGHAPAGVGGTRHVDGGLLFEYGALVVLLVMAVGFPLAVWSMWRGRDERGPPPKRGNWMLQLLLMTALAAAVIVAYMIYRSHRQNENGTATRPVPITRARERAAEGQRRQTARFDWVPLVVVLSVGLGGAAIALVLLTRAGQARPRSDEKLAAAALADALDESLDDLRAERDPRRAVIAAYARMERALAVAGVPRRPSEAALEYLARVLSDFLHTSAASITRLTALFERARFSHHEIEPRLKEEAIDALVAVRAELRTYSA